jgi:NADH-quinone oxidoreductase subunit K
MAALLVALLGVIVGSLSQRRNVVGGRKTMVPTKFYRPAPFLLSAQGVLSRRNALVFMCVEMMLNSVNLTLIAMSRQWGNLNGQIFVFMIMAWPPPKWRSGWPSVSHFHHTDGQYRRHQYPEMVDHSHG